MPLGRPPNLGLAAETGPEFMAVDPSKPNRGRGAVGNPVSRYTEFSREPFCDGWPTTDTEPAPRTEISVDAGRTIISTNSSPDIPFDRSINPYRGCEHGCTYCYARPTHAWLGLSPGLDFETRLFSKPNAADLLERQLARLGYRPRVLVLGSNTDPYQPIERLLRITRSIVEALVDCAHPLAITTKSAGVLRDLDLLAPMAERGLVQPASHLRGYMMTKSQMFGLALIGLVVPAALVAGDFGTAGEAKPMLEKVVAAVKADEAEALDMFTKGEGGFKDRGLYPYCIGPDGNFSAHPTLLGTDAKGLMDKAGAPVGEKVLAATGSEPGEVVEVSYVWTRPGDTKPVQKVAFVTRIGDQTCAVGYYN